MDHTYEKRADAGERLMKLLALVQIGDAMKVGSFCAFDLRRIERTAGSAA